MTTLGEPVENARDVVLRIEGDGARFTLADATAPAIIQDVADMSALYVLMPMRV